MLNIMYFKLVYDSIFAIKNQDIKEIERFLKK